MGVRVFYCAIVLVVFCILLLIATVVLTVVLVAKIRDEDDQTVSNRTCNGKVSFIYIWL